MGIAITAIFGGGSPVQLIVLAQSLTVLTAPVLAFLLVYLSTKGDFMGTLRNKWWVQLALVRCLRRRAVGLDSADHQLLPGDRRRGCTINSDRSTTEQDRTRERQAEHATWQTKRPFPVVARSGIDAQHAKGKLTAPSALAILLDEASFQELGALPPTRPPTRCTWRAAPVPRRRGDRGFGKIQAAGSPSTPRTSPCWADRSQRCSRTRSVAFWIWPSRPAFR